MSSYFIFQLQNWGIIARCSAKTRQEIGTLQILQKNQKEKGDAPTLILNVSTNNIYLFVCLKIYLHLNLCIDSYRISKISFYS